MNPKYMRYGLITAVTLIWGLIIYRIIGSTNTEQAVSLIPIENHTDAITTPGPDTFSLSVNYPDPFLPPDTLQDETMSLLPATEDKKQIPETPPPKPDISFIQYLGIIINNERKTRSAMITIHGQEQLVNEGETVSGIKIRKISPTGLSLMFQKEKFELPKKK